MSETNGALVPVPRKSITVAMADRYHMMPEAFEATVRATCFPANPPATKEEFAAGMLIAHKLDLNPVTKEIHFARMKQGAGVIGIIGVDGWYVMANKHPQYDGCSFTDNKDAKGQVVSVTCTIYRKDRTRPTEITEYLSECKRESMPWKLTPTRMLRHRAFGQCARVAFSFAGVQDADEFERWQEAERNSGIAVKARIAELPMPPEIPAISDSVPVELDVEPLPEGYLGSLEDQFASVKSGDIDSLNEAWAHNEDMIERLSSDDREKAMKLYRDHEARITL